MMVKGEYSLEPNLATPYTIIRVSRDYHTPLSVLVSYRHDRTIGAITTVLLIQVTEWLVDAWGQCRGHRCATKYRTQHHLSTWRVVDDIVFV